MRATQQWSFAADFDNAVLGLSSRAHTAVELGSRLDELVGHRLRLPSYIVILEDKPPKDLSSV